MTRRGARPAVTLFAHAGDPVEAGDRALEPVLADVRKFYGNKPVGGVSIDSPWPAAAKDLAVKWWT